MAWKKFFGLFPAERHSTQKTNHVWKPAKMFAFFRLEHAGSTRRRGVRVRPSRLERSARAPTNLSLLFARPCPFFAQQEAQEDVPSAQVSC